MIETFYSLDNLGSVKAFWAALLVGCAFGFFLERAGFGSSKKLASVFYFKDMTVVKVMFTAVITAMLGLSYLTNLDYFQTESMYLLPTIYGAQIAGGFIFGIGFVMGGWCPGTAAAGLADGKIDALFFLVGAIIGSVIFNELFAIIKPLYTMGQMGVLFIYDSLNISKPAFVFIFCSAGILCFWLCEYIEKLNSQTGEYFKSPFLKAFSLAVLIVATGQFILSQTPDTVAEAQTLQFASVSESTLMQDIENAADHIEPEELADRLMNGDAGLVLVDIRPANEFASFNIKGSVNIPIMDLASYLQTYKDVDTVVLYSNGMTHPAQARDSLYRLGFHNVYILTDGLNGFIERCLKPVSLRREPLSEKDAFKINQWRQYFSGLNSEKVPGFDTKIPFANIYLPGLIETNRLAENLKKNNIVVIDLRSQPEYNTSHIPGSLYLNVESFRGNVGGLGSMLLPVKVVRGT